MNAAALDEFARDILRPNDQEYVMNLIHRNCPRTPTRDDAEEHYFRCEACDGKFAAETLRFLENYYHAVRAK